MAVYAVDALGLYPETATNLLLVMLDSNLVGRFIFGYISEKVGHVNTMIPCAIFVGVIRFHLDIGCHPRLAFTASSRRDPRFCLLR